MCEDYFLIYNDREWMITTELIEFFRMEFYRIYRIYRICRKNIFICFENENYEK